MRLLLLALALGINLAGCATPIPLDNLRYDDPTTVTSSRQGVLVVIPGIVRGPSGGMTVMSVGNTVAAVPASVDPGLAFSSIDQKAVAESLRSELVRKGVLQTLTLEPEAQSDLRIELQFLQTRHFPPRQEYVIEAQMTLSGGRETMRREYRVISSEKDSLLQALNTNAFEGKVKAGKRLMEKLIPDIERYVAAMERATPVKAPVDRPVGTLGLLGAGSAD